MAGNSLVTLAKFVTGPCGRTRNPFETCASVPIHGASRRQARVHHRCGPRPGPQPRGPLRAGGRRHHRDRRLQPVAAAAYPMATEEDLAETARLVEAQDRRIVHPSSMSAIRRDCSGRWTRALPSCAGSRVVRDRRRRDRQRRHQPDGWPAGHLAEFREAIEINLTGGLSDPGRCARHGCAGQRRVGDPDQLDHGLASIGGIPGLHRQQARRGRVDRTAAYELASKNIRVNSVHPGNCRRR